VLTISQSRADYSPQAFIDNNIYHQPKWCGTAFGRVCLSVLFVLLTVESFDLETPITGMPLHTWVKFVSQGHLVTVKVTGANSHISVIKHTIQGGLPSTVRKPCLTNSRGQLQTRKIT